MNIVTGSPMVVLRNGVIMAIYYMKCLTIMLELMALKKGGIKLVKSEKKLNGRMEIR